MIAVTVTAACQRCDWTAAGDWDSVDIAAEKHTKTSKHPTATKGTPG